MGRGGRKARLGLEEEAGAQPKRLAKIEPGIVIGNQRPALERIELPVPCGEAGVQGLAELVVPGVLLDFDLPDLAPLLPPAR